MNFQPHFLEDGSLVCLECVECTNRFGFDVVYGLGCLINGHNRLIIPPMGEEE